jgi:hypothetical protein
MQASKWLTLPVLIDPSELQPLFKALGSFLIYGSSQVIPKDKAAISQEDFLAAYTYYVDALKTGRIPEESVYRSYFSSSFTVTPEALYAIELPNDRQLIRIYKPVVQLQPHSMDYSPYDGKFRSIVHGPECLLWGIQFSYPQQYLNPHTKQALKVVENDFFPNTHLFRLLQRWVRENTIPTPFQVEGRKVHIPVRLGKTCLQWINHHPQLSRKKLQVVNE